MVFHAAVELEILEEIVPLVSNSSGVIEPKTLDPNVVYTPLESRQQMRLVGPKREV
jgi:hypothetical protein